MPQPPAPASLDAHLRGRIRSHGPLTFAAFMEEVLYHPRHGYYSRPPGPWARPDYLTAPQLHPAYGAAVARLLADLDAALARPDPFTLVEFGGGDGTLLRDLCDALRAAHPRLYRRLRVVAIERSPHLRRLQRQRLGPHLARVVLRPGTALLRPRSVCGGFIANEFLDALPVHRVTLREGRLREIYVDVGDGGFVERLGPPSTAALREHLRLNRVRLREGQVAEVCLAAGEWVGTVATSLDRGFVLVVDYGDETEALHGPEHHLGTLVCHRRYRAGHDPYDNLGDQDITAHVDFGNLRRRARAAGLEPLGHCSLMAFLVAYGAASGAGLRRGDAGALRRHLALRHLLFSEIGQTHRALLLGKGLRPEAVRFGRQRLGAAGLNPPDRRGGPGTPAGAASPGRGRG